MEITKIICDIIICNIKRIDNKNLNEIQFVKKMIGTVFNRKSSYELDYFQRAMNTILLSIFVYLYYMDYREKLGRTTEEKNRLSQGMIQILLESRVEKIRHDISDITGYYADVSGVLRGAEYTREDWSLNILEKMVFEIVLAISDIKGELETEDIDCMIDEGMHWYARTGDIIDSYKYTFKEIYAIINCVENCSDEMVGNSMLNRLILK